MNFKRGYTIKPYRVTGAGEVLFTDGTNSNLLANQQQCEAYGYTYDRVSGTCRLFRYNTNLSTTVKNVNNRMNGPGNTTRFYSNTIQMNGTNNTANGLNNNCFINGRDNTIENQVNDATVVGLNGTALRDGEFVIGGGLINGSPIQTSTFFLTQQTTNAVAIPMFLSSKHSATATTIQRNSTSIITYTIDITAYRTGGASGSGAVGDRAFYKLQGVLKGNSTVEALTNVADDGVITGWTVASAFVSTSNWNINVRGAANMDINWTATANFYEMKL
mgnify:CR=1 FL=1